MENRGTVSFSVVTSIRCFSNQLMTAFCRANCNVLLRVLLKVLACAAKQALDRDVERKDKLNVWLKVMNTLDSIVSVLKSQYVRSNLICFVKGVPPILRLFLNHGIVICSTLFRSESSLVTQILKTLQITTRYLQKICDNTKVNLYVPIYILCVSSAHFLDFVQNRCFFCCFVSFFPP